MSDKIKQTEQAWNYTPLPEPIPITEQVWPEGTRPLLCTRHMTYNQEEYIRDCIEGVLMQKTTFPVRVCIHDDASTDNTAEIIREYEETYPNLIWAYYQEENTYDSPFKNDMRKEFMDWSFDGKYQIACEGDDYWTDPYKLQKQAALLINMNADACYSFWSEIKENKIKERKHDDIKTGDFLSQDKYRYFHTTTRMYRSDWLKKVKKKYPNQILVDTPIQYIALYTNLKIVILAEVTSMYRISGDGVWTSISEKEKVKWRFNMFSLLAKYIPQKRKYFYSKILENTSFSLKLRKNYFLRFLNRTYIYIGSNIMYLVKK